MIHRRKSLLQCTLRRTFLNRSKTDAESRLVLLGRAVTGKDSNLVSQLQSPIPSQHGAHDAYHVVDQRGPRESRRDSVSRTR